MTTYFVAILILLISSWVPLHAQHSHLSLKQLKKERKSQEAKLKLYRKQIKEYESILLKKKSDEKISLSTINILKNQMTIQKKLITEIETIRSKIESDIKAVRLSLKKEQRELSRIKNNFSNISVSIYKYQMPSPIESILTSESIEVGFRRIKYINVFKDVFHMRVKELVKKIRDVEESKKILQERLAYQTKLIYEKSMLVKKFESRAKQQEETIKKLRSDKTKYQALLEKRKQNLSDLQSKINQLIAAETRAIEKERAERARARQKKKQAKGTLPDTSRSIKPKTVVSKEDVAFYSLRGSLPFPVRNGVIVNPFGESSLEGSSVKTFNNGIDIAVGKDSPVYTVAEGKVSAITYLPTFGNIVIIRHAHSFIAVYANLDKIRITKGASVSKGQAIGRVSESNTGEYVLHFELWKERKPYDPTIWLAKM